MIHRGHQFRLPVCNWLSSLLWTCRKAEQYSGKEHLQRRTCKPRRVAKRQRRGRQDKLQLPRMCSSGLLLSSSVCLLKFPLLPSDKPRNQHRISPLSGLECFPKLTKWQPSPNTGALGRQSTRHPNLKDNALGVGNGDPNQKVRA